MRGLRRGHAEAADLSRAMGKQKGEHKRTRRKKRGGVDVHRAELSEKELAEFSNPKSKEHIVTQPRAIESGGSETKKGLRRDTTNKSKKKPLHKKATRKWMQIKRKGDKRGLPRPGEIIMDEHGEERELRGSGLVDSRRGRHGSKPKSKDHRAHLGRKKREGAKRNEDSDDIPAASTIHYKIDNDDEYKGEYVLGGEDGGIDIDRKAA